MSSSDGVVELTDATFDDMVRSGIWLVDFWAAWCAPCHAVIPTLDDLAQKADGRYRIAKLDVLEQPETAARFGILSLPTFIVFRDGEAARRVTGARSARWFEAELAES